MKSQLMHLCGLCVFAILSIASPAYATKEADQRSIPAVSVPVVEYHPHDDIRHMSAEGATLCSQYAVRILLEPARENKKAAFTSTRHYLVDHGLCRVVDIFPDLSNIDRVIPMTDDGEGMQLYIESVYGFTQDAGFGNAISIKKEYALCWQTSVDSGCF